MTHPFPVVSSGIDPVLYIYTIMIIIHTTEKSNRKSKNLFLARRSGRPAVSRKM